MVRKQLWADSGGLYSRLAHWNSTVFWQTLTVPLEAPVSRGSLGLLRAVAASRITQGRRLPLHRENFHPSHNCGWRFEVSD